MKNQTSRREFMAYTAALASTAAACGKVEEQETTTMTTTLTELSATDAIAAMQAGEITAETYASALLEKCSQWEHLNAWLALEPDKVLEAARAADRLRESGAALGPLHGLPIPVKDSVNTSEYPTTAGTRALENFMPAEDAELVEKLKSAGASVMGKTHLHELSFGWSSNNLAFGPVRNPYDTSRIPGGSSGGTGAAIAARMAPIGIAADTQGSIRVPAALCGVVGFRPTQNRYPNEGVVPITPIFDQVGPHTRSVADVLLFDQVIAGEEAEAPQASIDGLRLGVPRSFFFDSLETDVEQITLAAYRKLEDAGAVLVESDIPDLKQYVDRITDPVQVYHTHPMLVRYLADYGTGITFDELFAAVSDDIRAVFTDYVVPGAPNRPSDEQFAEILDVELPRFRQAMQDYFDDNELDGLMFPCTQVSATPIGQDVEVEVNGRMLPFSGVMGRNISPGSTTGIPGLVLPAALDSMGLPVSLEIDGPAGSDRRLLGIGVAIEQVLGHLPAPTA